MERRDQAGKARNEKVLNCLYQNPDAIFKLFCFPWAGGGSTYFAKWGQDIHDSVEVHSIRLAGRESRLDEPFATDINQVVDEVTCAMLPVLQDKPFAFFGHSLGSYFAFMTAIQLKEKYKLEPMYFFVSSSFPPHENIWLEYTQGKTLSDEQISSIFGELGGIPKNFVEDKELLQQYASKLRADAQIFINHCFDKPSEALLSCDLTCIFGSEDVIKDMKAWKEVTSGSFDIRVLPGDHFYLMETSNEIFIRNYIVKCLEISMLACV